MVSSKRIGQFLKQSTAGEVFKAYIPPPLPPEPPLKFSDNLLGLADEANLAIGRLDGASILLPNISLFVYVFLRKEALVSSQIEGTQSSFSDLILYENKESPGVPVEDVEEVANYVRALNYGLKRIADGFPLSLRLIKEIHKVLLKGVRGHHKMPGEFRRSQNWIGGSRPGNAKYVPPPPDKVLECLGALEKFLHNDPIAMPPLIKAALAHVQFETIHPFLDGNGRIGRLLITLILCHEEVLHQLTLYLSLYLKQNRDQYYELLQRVRTHGEWEEWLMFFLSGVKETAEQAVETIKNIQRLFEKDEKKISQLKRASASALTLYRYVQQHPIITVSKASTDLKISVPTISKTIAHLTKGHILKELTGKERDRMYGYTRYIKILSEGASPL